MKSLYSQPNGKSSQLMIHAACSLLCFLPGALIAQEFETPMTEWGVPDLQGYWKNNTVMPLERPQELGDKQAYTENEALQLEHAAQQRVEQDNQPDLTGRRAQALPPVGNYDLFWTDRGMFLPTINGEFRTSAIIDPKMVGSPERVAGFSDLMQELRARAA